VRVGLEDNFYLPDGTMAKSNADLLDVAVRKIRERGQEVASLEEARALLSK
jgi:3-keto-5-aminohexanoate cleavage enzyme